VATCASIGFRLPIAPGSECACWSSIERTEKVMSLGVYAPWAPRIRSTNALTAQVSPTGARVPRASRGPPPPPPPALDELQQLRLERLGAHLVVRVDAKQLQSLDDLRPAKGLLAHLGRSRHHRGHRPGRAGVRAAKCQNPILELSDNSRNIGFCAAVFSFTV
jgi:hypothetical protein